MNFDDLFWHDGVLLGVFYDNASSNIVICANVYESSEAPERRKYNVIFKEPVKLFTSIDFGVVKENAIAGNINDAYSRNGYIYRFFLVDGFIEIQCTEPCLLRETN